MNKKIISILSLMLLLTGCNMQTGREDTNDGKHIPDSVTMGEGILDDGGDINHSDPEEVASGVTFEGEHRILIEENSDKYELTGGAVDTADWSNSGFTTKRIRTANPSQSVIFTVDCLNIADTSKMGFMFTLINNRKYTQIAVSLDKEMWIDIGYGDSKVNGIKADYSTRIDSLLDNPVSDGNLYQCYYKLGKYAKSGQNLYIKAGYTEEHPNGLQSPTGADVIGYVSYFETMEIEYSYL